ncbi:hypothetical protein ABZ927_15960 [Streptomyces massasporeus]
MADVAHLRPPQRRPQRLDQPQDQATSAEASPSERLGERLRSTRYRSTADDQLTATVRYGPRVEEAGIVRGFFMVWNDLSHMPASADAVDGFARSLWTSEARQEAGLHPERPYSS